ncbi:hypothetical protein GCM10010415_14770 [Streptomyces atrovirens]
MTAPVAETPTAEEVPPTGPPSAARARSPHSTPSTNTAPTSSANRTARHPATVRIARRAAPGTAADQVKGGGSSRAAGRLKTLHGSL